MKKLIMFLAGLMLMLVTFASVYVASAIYDAGTRRSIDTYFFQPNGSANMRLGVPATAADLGNDKMRDLLVRKFVNDYFYVIPGDTDVTNRVGPMATQAVLSQWQQEQVPEIQRLAEGGVLRMVDVVGPIVKNPDSDFWQVEYQLTTWYTANDLTTRPEVTRGVMYLGIRFEDRHTELRDDIDIEKSLRKGESPASFFKFAVARVEME